MATNLQDDFPRNFNIEKSDQEKYNELRDNNEIFEETSHLDIFMMALSLGWKNQIKEELDNRYPLVNTQSMSDDKAWMVAAIAIQEEGVSVLDDLTQVRRIADQYANGGFPILLDKLKEGQPGSELKRFMTEMVEEIPDK